MNQRSQIEINLKKLSGQPIFRGTRVPIKALFDYLENGETIEEFLLDFPGVTRKQAVSVLEESRQKVTGTYS